MPPDLARLSSWSEAQPVGAEGKDITREAEGVALLARSSPSRPFRIGTFDLP